MANAETLSFQDLLLKLAAAHDREVANAKEGQEEEKSKLQRKIEELRQAAGSAKNEVRKENSELSEAEDIDTGLVHVKSASKGSGGVVKQPRMSQSSLASGGSPMRLSLRNFSEQDGEVGTTPSPRASGSGMLFGMVPSSPSAPRASSSSRKVAPAPAAGQAASRGRRNSAMLVPGVPAPKTPDPKKPSFGAPSLGAQTPPFTPRSSNGAQQSPQQSRARRGATVGLGGFTGEEVKLLPVWSKSTQGLAARVNVRSANAGMKDAEGNPIPGDCTSPEKKGTSSCRRCMRYTHALLSSFVSDPSSPRRITWEVFGLLLIIYDLIWLPMQVFDPTDSQFTVATGVLSSIYWTFDIPLSFLVGFAIQDQGVIEKDLQKIAWNYCTGWLSLDLAIVTIDWVINFLDWTSSSSVSAGEGISFFRIGKAVRFLRLLRLLRLLRAHGRLNELLEHVQSEVSVIFISVARLIAFIMLLNHMVACAWFWIGQLNRPDTWLLQADSDILVAPMAYQYFTALHWSLTQFTPASMEVVPKNEIERLFNVVVIISAMVIFSTFISAITNAMNQLRNLNSVSGMSKQLFFVATCSSLCTSESSGVAVTLLRLMPLSLRHDLSQEIYSAQFQHPFFVVCETCFLDQTRKIYSTALTEKYLSTTQELITRGENATHMHFLNSRVPESLLEYYEANAQEPTLKLTAGAWLCEAALWVKWTHKGTAKTNESSGCEVISVDAGVFQSILKDDAPVREYAKMFRDYFAQHPDSLSDVWPQMPQNEEEGAEEAARQALFSWAVTALGQAHGACKFERIQHIAESLTDLDVALKAEGVVDSKIELAEDSSNFARFVAESRRRSTGKIDMLKHGQNGSDFSAWGSDPSGLQTNQLLALQQISYEGPLASPEEGDEDSSSSSSSGSGLTDSDPS
ncbi:AKT1 [Symbiodinium sp. CCMP2592]|nr:AKT1 [Symbiodinium sp. CCMP2592]